MSKLSKIEGIGASYSQKLSQAGISSTDEFLQKAATPRGRKEIAEHSGISEKLIMSWSNKVDLCRVKGVSEEYSDLLEAAGVDTIPELATRNSEHLFEKMTSTNREKKLVRKLPTQDQVRSWVEQAKQLPRILTY